MFRRVLIANRGEIAVRVARACRDLGIECVAVYSSADRDSPVLDLANDAVCIGPPPAAKSYLNVPNLIEAAIGTGADALHPGYGFLAEDADLSEICADAGLTLIGPRPGVTERLADKAAVRGVIRDAGLPVLAGSEGAVSGLDEARRVAGEIGYPVALKASAGAGGRGIEVVHRAGELAGAFGETRALAQSAFGDPSVYIERYVAGARHIEVQVARDDHGTAVHLAERDCTVQRRHQKVVEESPSPSVPAHLRERLLETAVRGAALLGLTGVGTMEFLLDADGAFHFIEINCRLQVEHPVTEMVSGIDVVCEQIRLAAGERLSFAQEAVRPSGCAIECRVNAEDPEMRFCPTPGRLDRFEPPGGPWTRVDTGYRTGSIVPPHYDSLLAKVIVWAPDRPGAIARADRALSEFVVTGPGIRSTISILRTVLGCPAFREGRHDTGLLGELLAASVKRRTEQ